MTDRLLSTRETAELLGVRENTLVAWRSRGRSKPAEERRGPPFLTVGRSVKYRELSVRQWITDREERRSSK
jgi:predicted DNA-binding transcriptional regulator AlpA